MLILPKFIKITPVIIHMTGVTVYILEYFLLKAISFSESSLESFSSAILQRQLRSFTVEGIHFDIDNKEFAQIQMLR